MYPLAVGMVGLIWMNIHVFLSPIKKEIPWNDLHFILIPFDSYCTGECMRGARRCRRTMQCAASTSILFVLILVEAPNFTNSCTSPNFPSEPNTWSFVFLSYRFRFLLHWRTNERSSALPQNDAMWSIDQPSLVLIWVEAPNFTNGCTSPNFPSEQNTWRGV